MASDGMQGSEAFFVFGRGVLPVVRNGVLDMSAMLERASLLFRGVQSFRETPGSPGSAKTLSADPEGEEGSSAGREPASPRLNSEP